MKQGFTIVELLASIAIMGLVIIISVPAYEGINRTIKEQSYNSKISMLTKSTAAYVNKYHKDKVFDGDKNILLISLPYLIERNIFSADDEKNNTITNPLKGGNLEGFMKVTYDTDKYEIIVEYDEFSNYADYNAFINKTNIYNSDLNIFSINNIVYGGYKSEVNFRNDIQRELANNRQSIIKIYEG